MAIEASTVRSSYNDSMIVERVERELDEHLSKGRVRSASKAINVNGVDGYEYERTLVGALSDADAKELERRYLKAGWDEVSFTPQATTTTARLFLKK